MGSFCSSSKATIENIALPAPQCSYNRSSPNLTMIDDVATMWYIQNCSKTIIIYSHGNATDIGYIQSLLLQLSEKLKTSIVSYDYEGYGLTPGTPSESGCNRSLKKVYNYLIHNGYSPTDIILYGVSIGTGPTIELAYKNKDAKFKGIVLQTPYTSVVGVVSRSVAYCSETTSSFSFSNPDLFLNSQKIPSITSPITIIHGTKDEVIPYDHAVKLSELNDNIKLVTLENANHNNIERDFTSELCYKDPTC